jgi:hypothetical protein
MMPSYEVWVDFAHNGTERGTASEPMDTVAEGVLLVLTPGAVRIFSGSSSETIRITKAVRLETIGGPVRIGSVS